jgi:leader peptidase (prepilin peptidase)/N-methyltransferase
VTETHRIVFTAFAGVFGLLVGSFLNVCIFRLPRNCMSIVKPRSRCTRCLKFIAWYDNFPVASWLILGGKCRNCREPISVRYPLVELLTGAIFAAAAWAQLWRGTGHESERAVWWGVQAYLTAALIVCTFIDLEFRILPDEITISGIVLGLACGAAFPFLYRGALPAWGVLSSPHLRGLAAGLLGAALGIGVTYAVRVLGSVLFKREAMGLGDVKLMGFLGAFLGWKGVLLTFLLGCFAGALYGVVHLLARGTIRRVAVPFGPFLALGALVMVYFSPLVDQGIQAYLNLVRRPV